MTQLANLLKLLLSGPIPTVAVVAPRIIEAMAVLETRAIAVWLLA